MPDQPKKVSHGHGGGGGVIMIDGGGTDTPQPKPAPAQHEYSDASYGNAHEASKAIGLNESKFD